MLRLDPFTPPASTDIHEIKPGLTIREWLDESGLGAELTRQPIVVFHNADAVTESEYDRTLAAGDIVLLAGQPGIVFTFGAVLFWVGVGLTVASSAYALYLALTIDTPQAYDAGEQSPTYSTTYRGNRRRPGQPIPVAYGLTRVWPDYTGSFSEFDDANNQWLVQLFDVTQGEANLDENWMYYEDTPITNFPDRRIEILAPGETSKLFPQTVHVSSAVNGIELIYPPDSGPPLAFVSSPVGTSAYRIAVDIQAPQGIYSIDDGGPDAGEIDFREEPVTVEYREIDDFDAPTGGGAWVVAQLDDGTLLQNYKLASVDINRLDPVRRTFTFEPTPGVSATGRYEVRIYRGRKDSESQYVVDNMQWSGMRAFESSSYTTTTTRVAIRVRQSERIGNYALSQFNLLVQRKVPVWNGSSWSAPQANPHPVWAFADALRADWGAKLDDARIDLDQLLALASLYPNDEFNGVFDTKQTLWAALQDILRPMLCRPIQRLDGAFSIAEDTAGQLPVALFTMRNIVKDSFSIEHVGVNEQSNDSVKATYFDKDQSYREASVLCVPVGSPGLNPAQRTLRGVTDKDTAFKIGIRMANENRYRRKVVRFSTGVEGYIPSFGDVVRVSHFMVGSETLAQSISGEIKSYSTNNFTPYDDISTFNGLPNLYLIVRNRDGTSQGPIPCTVAAGVINAPTFNETLADLTYMLYALGEGQNYTYDVKVTAISPTGDQEIAIEGFVDDQNAYIQSGTPVPSPLPPFKNIAPEVYNLEFSINGRTSLPDKSAQNLVVSWMGRRADFYEVEYSVDNGPWTLFTRTSNTQVQARPPITTNLRVRVTGVNVMRGTPVMITVNTETYFLELPRISGLRLVDDFVGDRATIAWLEPPYYTNALVRVYWGSPSVLRREVEVYREVSRFDYTIDMAIEDGNSQHDGLPIAEDGARDLDFEVYVIDGYGNMSAAPTTLSVSNDQVLGIPNVQWFESGGNLNIKYQYPVPKNVADFAGIEVHLSASSGFTPDDTTLVYVGDSNDITLIGVLDVNSTYYLRVGGFDIWGRDNIFYSNQVQIDTTDDEFSGVIDWDTQIVGPGKPDDNANLSGKGILNVDPGFELTWQRGFGLYWVNEAVGYVSLVELAPNDYAVQINAYPGVGAYFSSAQFYEILENESITFKFRFLYSAAFTNTDNAQIGARFYDKDKNLLGTKILVDTSSPGKPSGVFHPYAISISATDPDTRFVTLFGGVSAAASTGYIQLDYVKATEGSEPLGDGINLVPPAFAVFDPGDKVTWTANETNARVYIVDSPGIYSPGFLVLEPDYDGSLGYTNIQFYLGRTDRLPLTLPALGVLPSRRFILSFWMQAKHDGGSAPDNSVRIGLYFPGQSPALVLPERGLRINDSGFCSGMLANTPRQFACEFDLTAYPSLRTGTIMFEVAQNLTGFEINLDGLMLQRRVGEHSLNDYPALKSVATVGFDSIVTGNLMPDSVVARYIGRIVSDFVPPNTTNWHRLITSAGIEWHIGNKITVEGQIECSAANPGQVLMRLVTPTFGTSAGNVFNVEMTPSATGLARFSFTLPLTSSSTSPESWHLEIKVATTSILIKATQQTYLLVQEEKR